MEEQSKKPSAKWKQKAGVLVRPKNLTRTILSTVPYVGNPLVEMQNQLEAHDVQEQLAKLDAADSALTAKLHQLEGMAKQEVPPLNEWPMAAAEFLARTVDFVVTYDGGLEGPERKGRELFKHVAHGCLIAKNEVLTSVEALDLAQDVATDHQGHIRIMAGAAWYEFEAEPVDKRSGLVLCRLTKRDEKKWREVRQMFTEDGIRDPVLREAKASLTPWIGQEIGFIHTGEATDVMRVGASISKRQFDTTTISHFRRPSDAGLKVFVTGVLPGRIVHAGAPAFTRNGTLVGIVADTESYKSDAGRRAAVRSLLLHPRFMHLAKDSKKAQED